MQQRSYYGIFCNRNHVAETVVVAVPAVAAEVNEVAAMDAGGDGELGSGGVASQQPAGGTGVPPHDTSCSIAGSSTPLLPSCTQRHRHPGSPAAAPTVAAILRWHLKQRWLVVVLQQR